MSQFDSNSIKEIVSEFFEKTSFSVDIESIRKEEDTVFVSLIAEEPQILIGEGGQTLNEIQHILKLIVKKKTEGISYLDVDINNYKQKKIDSLKELAVSAANEVALTRSPKELPSMTAYERRIVHMELAGRDDIATESAGEEPDRKIIIKPHF